jgi:hypothetical protein
MKTTTPEIARVLSTICATHGGIGLMPDLLNALLC